MLLSQQMVDLIEHNADELSKRWLEDVRRRPETPTYHTFDPDALYSRVHMVYSHLGQWISNKASKEEIATHYTALGGQRRKEGFALSEVIQALIITRRYIWLKILSDGLLDTALDLHKSLDLNNRVVLFFDRAIYYTAMGYEKERNKNQ
jgi:hypothetical protein